MSTKRLTSPVISVSVLRKGEYLAGLAGELRRNKEILRCIGAQVLGLNYVVTDAKKLKGTERRLKGGGVEGGGGGDDETNYLIKAIRCTVSKPGFPSLSLSHGNPLSANWGVPCLMSEERRAKRHETKRRRRV